MSLNHILKVISDRQRESLFKKLKDMYDQLEQDFKDMPKPCTQCGLCCNFTEFGHKLYISSLEFAYVSTHLNCDKIHSFDECPYMDKHLCRARDHRMLGCRTFFRLHEEKDSNQAQDLYEKYLGQLKELYKTHHIPWEYKDFMVFVKDFYC